MDNNYHSIKYSGNKDVSGNFSYDHWPHTLRMAKKYDKLKPWTLITDEQIFAIYDEKNENYLFCSVIGQAKEMFGLTVYIGMEGFFSLIDILTGAKSEFDILQRQHSLLVSFEDRKDINTKEYTFIKQYDVSFSGKKAWPSFISFIPGYYPWAMNNDEARMMSLALEETMAMYEEIKAGLQLPDLLTDEEIIVRTKRHHNDTNYESVVEKLDEIMLEEDDKASLTISELELKRVSKIKQVLPVTIEFTLTYVNMSIEREAGERPFFPLTVIVADHHEEIILHHELYEETLNQSIVQREFINLFHNLNGIPQTILTDDRTYYYIGPLLNKLKIDVEVVEELPVVDDLLDGLQEFLAE